MFEEQGEGRRRRIREAQARSRSAATRRAMLELLREGPLSRAEVRAGLVGNPALSVVNYHLSVLVSEGDVVGERGRFRLA